MLQTELTHRLAKHRAVRNDHAPMSDGTRGLQQVLVGGVPDDTLVVVQIPLCTHGQNSIAGVQQRTARGGLHIRCTAPLDSRDHDARFAAWNVIDRDPFQIGIINNQRPSLQRFNGLALLEPRTPPPAERGRSASDA